MRDIDLDNHRAGDNRVFSGREYGVDVRRALQLDKEDQRHELVRIIVPQNTLSLNSSFFLGLFGPSVRALGENAFRAKYAFIGPDRIRPNIETGIRRALLTKNPVAELVA